MDKILHPFSLLYLEDEDSIRKGYVEYLKLQFKEVYEASDGKEAYKIYKNKQPDILILDIQVPKMNGLELLKKIRETDVNTKVLMLTSHTETHLLLDAVGLQITKYLVKPISRAELKGALQFVIDEVSKFTVITQEKIQLKENHVWNITTQELSLKGSVISLTKKELQLLSLLLSNINLTFSIYDMILEIWGYYDEAHQSSLKTIIKNLRKKLPEDSIINVFSVGYKIASK